MTSPTLVRLLAATVIAVAAGLSSPACLAVGGAMPADTGLTSTARLEVWRLVKGVMRQRGFRLEQLPGIEDVILPMALPESDGQKFLVESACWDEAPSRAQFRLECSAPGHCLPFLVYVRESADDSSTSARMDSCRLPPSPSEAAGSGKPLVRTGDKAIAVFLGNGLRMSARVRCLEHGRAGEIIRVRALDGHVFRARVSGPDQLEALPQ